MQLSIKDNPFFGMSKDEKITVAEQMKQIRIRRFAAIYFNVKHFKKIQDLQLQTFKP